MSLITFWYQFDKATFPAKIKAKKSVTHEWLDEIALKREDIELGGFGFATMQGVLMLDYDINFPKSPQDLETPLLRCWEMGAHLINGGDEARELAEKLATITDTKAFAKLCLEFTGEPTTQKSVEDTRIWVEESLANLRQALTDLPADRIALLAMS
ncbi:hypothetical protein DB346_13390 [Verrucomicrobia bacterium LW23]|nr:hypothetical protein DB346_13390 [Verrucomicrobia bacterium LW23]